ncbi:threonine transporter RhtB [Labrys miyagiensis]|uniref:Threonine transporter RhtB n=1 Tax=Labrys miyagiensis TaxID=346912 RepID=A0ABQ6CMV8_9HYPH|nr:LysE family transporter [Labrys miyagiensis]GLS20054.1 threonine transporter RhtB [Labrys miyagiensis]
MGQFFLPAGMGPALLSLVLASLVVMGSPGPSTISVTAIASAFGLRRSLPYLMGIILGTCLVLLCVAAGLASILLSQPRLSPWLIGLSSIYILYLAYKIATAPPLAKADSGAVAPAFTGGLLLALANPKAYVAIAAVFAGARLGLASEGAESLIKTAVLTIMIVLIHAGWSVAGASFARLLQQPATSRLVNLSFAAILAASTAATLVTVAR